MLRTPNRMRRSERGMSMIELLIAMIVLAVGLAGIMILISGAIASNNRNKLDTTATTLAEMVMERIAASGPSATNTFTITDCANTSLTIDPRGSTSPGYGAVIFNSGFRVGNIDFANNTAGTPASGYSANYVNCGANGSSTTYDIRWNVTTLQGGYSKIVTVSARQIAYKDSGTARDRLKFFAPPVTLRTIVSQ